MSEDQAATYRIAAGMIARSCHGRGLLDMTEGGYIAQQLYKRHACVSFPDRSRLSEEQETRLAHRLRSRGDLVLALGSLARLEAIVAEWRVEIAVVPMIDARHEAILWQYSVLYVLTRGADQRAFMRGTDRWQLVEQGGDWALYTRYCRT